VPLRNCSLIHWSEIHRSFDCLGVESLTADAGSCVYIMCACKGLDGSTSGLERERLINLFNAEDNDQIRIFLLSTR